MDHDIISWDQIDWERVVNDPGYRRAVIEYLNRSAREVARPSSRPFKGEQVTEASAW
jgi:hypothetical protein